MSDLPSDSTWSLWDIQGSFGERDTSRDTLSSHPKDLLPHESGSDPPRVPRPVREVGEEITGSGSRAGGPPRHPAVVFDHLGSWVPDQSRDAPTRAPPSVCGPPFPTPPPSGPHGGAQRPGASRPKVYLPSATSRDGPGDDPTPLTPASPTPAPTLPLPGGPGPRPRLRGDRRGPGPSLPPSAPPRAGDHCRRGPLRGRPSQRGGGRAPGAPARRGVTRPRDATPTGPGPSPLGAYPRVRAVPGVGARPAGGRSPHSPSWSPPPTLAPTPAATLR